MTVTADKDFSLLPLDSPPVDSLGNAYVTGVTRSTDFPTQGAYQDTYQGASKDGFVSKLFYISCCVDMRGNFDSDEQDVIDIADLVYMVEHQFNGGLEPLCTEEADIDGIDGIDVGDIVYMVEFQFSGGPPPPDCP